MSELRTLISELEAIPQANLHGLNIADLVSTVTKLDAEAKKISASKQRLQQVRSKLQKLRDRRP